jgi:hypothetical protein
MKRTLGKSKHRLEVKVKMNLKKHKWILGRSHLAQNMEKWTAIVTRIIHTWFSIKICGITYLPKDPAHTTLFYDVTEFGRYFKRRVKKRFLQDAPTFNNSNQLSVCSPM